MCPALNKVVDTCKKCIPNIFKASIFLTFYGMRTTQDGMKSVLFSIASIINGSCPIKVGWITSQHNEIMQKMYNPPKNISLLIKTYQP